MQTIGLLGGMSWESTLPYYQTINRVVADRLGGLHSARIVLYSVDFHEIEQLQRSERWHDAGELLADAASTLEASGADFLVLCTNTMHKVAAQIEARLRIPLFHIADATADEVLGQGLQRVGLLGTRFTMEQEFYRKRLEHLHGLEVLIPPEPDRGLVHHVIYDELCAGKQLDGSRAEYRRIVADLVSRGAEGIVLGCTEIGLLLGPSDAAVPLFDTATIHARRAALLALGVQRTEAGG